MFKFLKFRRLLNFLVDLGKPVMAVADDDSVKYFRFLNFFLPRFPALKCNFSKFEFAISEMDLSQERLRIFAAAKP